MNRLRAIAYFGLIFFGFGKVLMAQQTCKEVIGYYAGWQWYDRNKLMNPQSIPYQKYSILTYAFFQPQADGTLRISDPWGDKNQLLGPINWSKAPAGYDTQYDFGNPEYHQPGQKLSDYAHRGGCKLMVSLGGWTYSDKFPGIAADVNRRATFARECRTVVELYGLDGIDIDWEYPADASQKQNFTLLLKQVRDTLNVLSAKIQQPLLLTIAAGASPSHINMVEWDKVAPLVDVINLMSYDFYGTWDSQTNHNAPLNAVAKHGQTGFSCSEAVNNMLAAGVPADKITLGLAWYGRSHITSGAPGLQVPGTGKADVVRFTADEGTPLYYNIVAAQSDFNSFWDSTAMVPYLVSKTGNTFVSYDNERSVGLKAQEILRSRLRGAIIWEISGDYIESTATPGTIASTPLIDTLNKVLCAGPATSVTRQDVLPLQLYPNPVRHYLSIRSALLQAGQPLAYVVSDLNGRVLLRGALSENETTIRLSKLSAGTYLLQLRSRLVIEQAKFVVE